MKRRICLFLTTILLLSGPGSSLSIVPASESGTEETVFYEEAAGAAYEEEDAAAVYDDGSLSAEDEYADDDAGYTDDAAGYGDIETGYAEDDTGYTDDDAGYEDDAAGYDETAAGYEDDAAGYDETAAGEAGSDEASAAHPEPEQAETSAAELPDEVSDGEESAQEDETADADLYAPGSEQADGTAAAGTESAAESVAEEAGDQAVKWEAEAIEVVPGGNTDPEDLFGHYTDSELYPDGLVSGGLFSDGDMSAAEEAAYAAFSLNALETRIYDALVVQARKVANGSRASTILTVPVGDVFTKTKWTAKELGLSSCISGWQPSYEAMEAVQKKNPCSLDTVLTALIAGCPYELYWYDKTSVTRMYGWEYTADRSSISVTGSLTFYMPVVWDFADGYYVVNTVAGRGVQSIVSKAKSIVSSYASASDENKLRGYLNTICGLVSYNYNAIYSNEEYGNPWQMIWVFDGDSSTNVVCEGYSKAFQYLCDLTSFSSSRIESCIVTGGMSVGGDSGDHMWNVVRMQNGRSYLVDVTNCDSGSFGSPDKLFLAGTKDKITEDGIEIGCRFYLNGSYAVYIYDDDTLSIFNTDDLLLSTDSYQSGKVYSLNAASGVQVSIASQTYTGTARKPAPVVRVDGVRLINGTDYTVTYSNNVAVGTGKAVIKGKGYYGGSLTRSFQIKAIGSVANAAVSGIVSKVYDGTAQKQSPVVKLGGKTLKLNTDYTLSYKTNINPGRAAVVITGKGGYIGELIKYFAVKPKPTWVMSLTAGSKAFKAVWAKRNVRNDGYELIYSTDKTFKKGSTTKTISNVNTTSLVVKKLKAKTTYYVMVRTYKKANGKVYYSPWCKLKSVRTK